MAETKHIVSKKTKAQVTDAATKVVKKSKKQAAYTPNESVFQVSELLVAYERNPRYTDDISLLKRSKEGLSAQSALDFLELSGISHDQFQQVFKTTVKTIQNYAAKQLVLDAALSEKLIKLFALFELGAEVFGGVTYFNQWIHTSAYGLGYQVPLEMMETITGIKLVEDQLLRIAYGALA